MNNDGSVSRALKVVIAVVLIGCVCPLFAADLELVRQIIFVDQSVEVVGEIDRRREYQVARVTLQGSEAQATTSNDPEKGPLLIPPTGEGLHVITFSPPAEAELRFLAINVPDGAIDGAKVRQRLPHFAQKLLSGQPVTILVTGDSVTATGDYPLMLKMLLERLTGNQQITIATAAYPGKSTDAAVRHWDRDAALHNPDLLLVMFGLNDQSGGVPRQAYLQNHRWMVDQMRKGGGEVVFLQPTPVASEEVDAAGVPTATRTAVFAHALAELGRELDVPVAYTFAAIWGAGDADPRRAALAMRPLFPPHYSKRFESAAEPGRSLDPVHPNALGHLQIAHAVLDAMQGTPPPEAPKVLDAAGQSVWTDLGVVSRLSFRNPSDVAWTGGIDLVGQSDAEIQAEGWQGTLAPGEVVTLPVRWTQAREPRDLLSFPMDRYLAEADPAVLALLSSRGGTHVKVVEAPFAAAAELQRGRQMTTSPEATVQIRTDAGLVDRRVTWPADSKLGRIPFMERFEDEGQTGWAVGEVVYLRVPTARSGQTIIDGTLSEWADADWTPLDDPLQARWTRGSQGLTAEQIPIKLKMALRAGSEGVAIAFKHEGTVAGNRFFVWFDPRTPEELGTVGRYYWISGELIAADSVRIRRGETSPPDERLAAAAGQGVVEIFVPYATMEQSGWPDSGDLGLSVHWQALDAHSKPVNLLWADDGHPWNPRWYGVVQRANTQPAAHRYRVRID